MEGSAEVNESIDNNSVQGVDVHLKRKENDEQLPRQVDTTTTTSSELERAPQMVVTPRSPEDFMEHLAAKGASFDRGGSGSENGTSMEELTLSNYGGVSSFRGKESSGNKGFWNSLSRLGDDRLRDLVGVGSREHGENLFTQPPFLSRRPPPFGSSSPYVEPNYSKEADLLAKSDNRTAPRSALKKPMEGAWKKAYTASGFAQFLAKSSSRGKGVAFGNQGTETSSVVQNPYNVVRANNNAEVDTKSFGKPGGKVDEKVLVGGGGGESLDTHQGEISLREWLTPRHHKLDKVERLNMFKQILRIVDASHSQGLVLVHLRPSFILISSSSQVKYAGSFVPKSQVEQLFVPNNQDINYFLQHPSKRKRYSEPNKRSLSANHQNHGEYKNYSTHGNVLSSSACKPSTSELLKLEEKWYASPEELNNCALSLSSNIYSLGVLLFEFFCYFETWESHSVAMTNLRYRILPPSFLSESSKEAGFCLWLLHPEPSSRPNSRDILLSDLINEGQDLFADQSSASIDEEDAEADLLLHFLLNLKEEKEKQAAKLVADVGCLTGDLEEVERRYSLRTNSTSNANEGSDTPTVAIDCSDTPGVVISTANGDRLTRNLDRLENAYFSMRSKVGLSGNNSPTRSDSDVLRIRDRSSQIQNDDDVWKDSTDSLGSFFEGLCKYARYSKFELCGSLTSVDILNSVNVICSLSFDRDEDYFAAAGVSKKIKIFEYSALLNDRVDIHYPLIEMSGRSKFSCVSWNNYIKNYLASTDYEGVVQLWDASTGQGFTQYTEHQKRAWSVDFSLVDPTKLASGSDDCSVKIWSIKERNCIDTIRNVANVCCVQFSSYSSQLLAFGSADYRICCYDLRYTRIPWCTLAGHGKAVSYVKFVDPTTIVSASTDNTLKIWDLNKTMSSGLSTDSCSLTLSGHTNEKNFVGLSVCDGYIACGSETNEVYAYYRTLPMPITTHKFGSTYPISGQETGEDNGQFVSSVCWRSKSNTVVAANSSGSIKLLRMV